MNIRDRVIDQRKVPASSLRPSPMNWRTHPIQQRDALRGVLAEIGFAGAELVRQCEDGTLELIDGHLRAEEMGDQLIPVTVTNLTEAEAKKLLVVYDPIGAMAGADNEKLESLLREIDIESPALLQMVEEMASEHLGTGFEVEPDPEKAPTVKEQFQVLIVAKGGKPLTEKQQVELLERFAAESYDARALTS